MNDLFVTLGIESWKSALGVLLLPPVPFVLMVLLGGRLMFRRRLLAWTLLLLGALGIWFMSTTALSSALRNLLVAPPRALGSSDIGDLKKAGKTTILVLGGGRQLLAPEYGVSDLSTYSLDRLRYGIWLSRETGLPIAFSGGLGHGAAPGPSEAEIAARIAEREFNRPLKWLESASRDTTENAALSLKLLHDAGLERIVLVTNDFHMRRALGAFAKAKERSGIQMDVLAAPMGLPSPGRLRWADWFPSPSGFEETRVVLHEWIGRLAGA